LTRTKRKAQKKRGNTHGIAERDSKKNQSKKKGRGGKQRRLATQRTDEKEGQV